MVDKFQEAKRVIKSGDKEWGKQLLVEVLEENPKNDQAWIWMSSVVDTDDLRQECLEEALAINPNNTTAKKGLVKLQQKQTSTSAPASELKTQPIKSTSTWSYEDSQGDDMLDKSQQVHVKKVQKEKKLAWYEWIFAGFPGLLIFVGGAIGGGVGFGAIALNLMIFRSNANPVVKYASVIAVGIGAFILYFVLAVIFSLVING